MFFFAEERSNLTTHRDFQNSPCVAFPKIIVQQKIWKLLFRLGSSIHEIIQLLCKFDIISCPQYVYVIDMSPSICSLAYVYCILSVTV